MDGWSGIFGQTTFPRILVFDRTAKGDGSATGELKANLFANWPDDSYLQVFHIDGRRIGVKDASGATELMSADHVDASIRSFNPQLILYRPVHDTPMLHRVAMSTIRRLRLPLVTSIMDDWPALLEVYDQRQFRLLDPDFRWLLQRSNARLSICDAMSQAFEARYGVPFVAIANGIDPGRWRPAMLRTPKRIRIRYAGSLAENMTLGTLQLIAEAVERLAESGIDIIFEVKTHPWWHGLSAKHFEQYPHVNLIVTLLAPDEYIEWLSDADILIIAYNFDDVSKVYVRYSMANKLPECLASGVPLLAVGPDDIAPLQYLAQIDAGVRVVTRNREAIKDALRSLALSPEYRLALASHAQRVAFNSHDISEIRDQFTALLQDAASRDDVIAAEYICSDQAVIDETKAVIALARCVRTAHDDAANGDDGSRSDAPRSARSNWQVVSIERDSFDHEKLVEKHWTSPEVSPAPWAAGKGAAFERAFHFSRAEQGPANTHGPALLQMNAVDADLAILIDAQPPCTASSIDLLIIRAADLNLSILEDACWSRIRPEIVACEYDDSNSPGRGGTAKHIAAYLLEQGYAVYLSEWHPRTQFDEIQYWRRVIPYPKFSVPPRSAGTILAFRVDPGYPAVHEAFAQALRFPKDDDENADAPSHRQVQVASTEPANDVAVDVKSAPDEPLASITSFDEASTPTPSREETAPVQNATPRRRRRKWWKDPRAIALALAVAVAVSPFVSPALRPFRVDLWYSAALIAMLTISGNLFKKTLRRRFFGMSQRLESLEARLAEMENRLAKNDERLDFHGAYLKNHDVFIGGLETRLDNRLEDFDELLVVLDGKVKTLSLPDVSVELVAALRSMRALWVNPNAGTVAYSKSEHGHGLLMSLLVEEERAKPGTLAGSHLIEIGTTRERFVEQASTEKLSIFSAITGVNFMTVDVDPINTERARTFFDNLSLDARAITMKGENYLALYDGSLDFVYLDAFDYDHGKHSQERRARYRDLLQTDINDQECWQMHKLCAQQVSQKMRVGGLVVVDDTWTDQEGAYDGKGRLAVPHLLEKGFEVLAVTTNTVALRRIEIR